MVGHFQLFGLLDDAVLTGADVEELPAAGLTGGGVDFVVARGAGAVPVAGLSCVRVVAWPGVFTVDICTSPLPWL